METGALWEQVSWCCSLANSTGGINIYMYTYTYIYIYSYSPNREEQRNLTGNSFKLILSITVPFLHLSLQTKQLCTLKTREITNSQARAGTFSVLLFVLLWMSFLLPAHSGQLPLSDPPLAPLMSESAPPHLLVWQVVKRGLGGREGGA